MVSRRSATAGPKMSLIRPGRTGRMSPGRMSRTGGRNGPRGPIGGRTAVTGVRTPRTRLPATTRSLVPTAATPAVRMAAPGRTNPAGNDVRPTSRMRLPRTWQSSARLSTMPPRRVARSSQRSTASMAATATAPMPTRTSSTSRGVAFAGSVASASARTSSITAGPQLR